jgi:prepilin signal peptidase PulO-like enzyme (type II secretory pathway)
MVVLLHVLIALSSIAYTTYLYFSPSRRKFYTSYGLIAATLISGAYLVISTHSPLLSSCATGLVYLSLVAFGLFTASSKLAKEHQR